MLGYERASSPSWHELYSDIHSTHTAPTPGRTLAGTAARAASWRLGQPHTLTAFDKGTSYLGRRARGSPSWHEIYSDIDPSLVAHLQVLQQELPSGSLGGRPHTLTALEKVMSCHRPSSLVAHMQVLQQELPTGGMGGRPPRCMWPAWQLRCKSRCVGQAGASRPSGLTLLLLLLLVTL